MDKKILLHSCCGPCSIMCLEYLKENKYSPDIFYYNPNIHPQKEYFLRLFAMQQVAEKYQSKLIIGNNKDFFDRIKKKPEKLNTAWIQHHKKELFSCNGNNPAMKAAVQKILNKWQAYAELFPRGGFDRLCIFADGRHTENPSQNTIQSLLLIDSYAFVKHLSNYAEKERCKECYKERMTQSVLYAKEQGYTEFTSTLLYSKYQDHDDICNAVENAVSLANSLGSSTDSNAANSLPLRFYYADFRQFWQEGIDKSKELNIYRQKWCGCILSRLDSLEQMAKREYEKILKRSLTL